MRTKLAYLKVYKEGDAVTVFYKLSPTSRKRRVDMDVLPDDTVLSLVDRDAQADAV